MTKEIKNDETIICFLYYLERLQLFITYKRLIEIDNTTFLIVYRVTIVNHLNSRLYYCFQNTIFIRIHLFIIYAYDIE